MHLSRRAVAAAAALTMTASIATALAMPASARNLPFGPGQASAITATATTQITNDPDSGHGSPAVWAIDTITRTVTVTKGTQVPGTDCGLPASSACYSYTAALADSGSFTTVPGAGTPNQACAGCAGLLVKAPAVSGVLQGTYTVTFDASYPVADASLVARSHDDHSLPASPPYTSTTWGEQFFPAGTHFGNVTGGAYTWTYQVVSGRWPFFTTQRWVDSSSNGDGNEPQDGNVTG